MVLAPGVSEVHTVHTQDNVYLHLHIYSRG